MLRGVAVSEVTERINELGDLLLPDLASEVERMLVRLTHGDDDWQTFSAAAFSRRPEGEPKTVKFEITSLATDMTIPFEFKNLPLP